VIDEDPSFSDQTEFTSQITRVAEDDVLPTINGRNADTHSKFSLEVSRERRDCDLSAKHCEMLLQTVQNYLESLSNQFPATNGGKSLPGEILKCLKCKEMITNKNENYTLQPKDQYFPHDYVKQNRSSDFGTVVIKLLDDKEAKNGSKQTEVNRTEAAKIQVVETERNSVTDNPLQDVTNQSLKNTSISETNTISIDPTDSNGSQRIYINNTDNNNSSGINDKQPDSNSAVNDSRVIQNGFPAVSKIDQQHHVINKSEDVTSVKPWFTTKSSSTRTQYSSTIMGDDEQFRKITAADSVETTETSTETRTIIDLTKQITENVTTNVMPDVIGIDGSTVQPSARPSFEGHPENQSIAASGTCLGRIHRRK